MDMSFSLDEATPLALPPPLSFAELTAAIREARGTVPLAAGLAFSPSDASSAPASVAKLLADVALGRPNWRAASLALGGRFADVPDAGGTASAGRA